MALERTRSKMGDVPMNRWAGEALAVKSLGDVLNELRRVPSIQRSSVMNEVLSILSKPHMVVNFFLASSMNLHFNREP